MRTKSQPERPSLRCSGEPAPDTHPPKNYLQAVITLLLSNHDSPPPQTSAPAPSPASPSRAHPFSQPPHFWGGSFNATAKSLKKRCKKHSAMLIAVTARSCGHCLDFEPSYRWAVPAPPKPQTLKAELNPKP